MEKVCPREESVRPAACRSRLGLKIALGFSSLGVTGIQNRDSLHGVRRRGKPGRSDSGEHKRGDPEPFIGGR